MDADEIRALVGKVLGRIAPEAELDTLESDVEFQEQLDLDSMDFLNFVTGLHEATGLEIPERDYAQLASLDGCIRYLGEHTT